MPGASADISENVTPFLDGMQATLRDSQDINNSIGEAVTALCKIYVADDAPNRRNTANKLGTDKTMHFLGDAERAITWTASSSVIVVDFNHPWFASVDGPVHIVPGPGKQFLAIPIGADAYGVRLSGREDAGGTFFKGPSGGLFWGVPYPGNPKVLQPLYILLPYVDQPQDRSRLPSDAEILACINKALRTSIVQRLQALNSMTP